MCPWLCLFSLIIFLFIYFLMAHWKYALCAKCAIEKEAALPCTCLLSQCDSGNSRYCTHGVVTIHKLKVRLQTISCANYLCLKPLPILIIPAEPTWHFLHSASVLLSFGELTHIQDEKYDLHISKTLTPTRVAEEGKKKRRYHVVVRCKRCEHAAVV